MILSVRDDTTGKFVEIPALKGEKGDIGPQGERGLQGPVGPQGEKGVDGAAGAQGERGPAGSDGYSPAASVTKAGTTATITIIDKTGTTTATVVDGTKGDKGDKGDTGEKGDNGITFVPIVSEEGVLSWSNDGDLPNPASVNLKGAKGDIGAEGLGIESITVTESIVDNGSNIVTIKLTNNTEKTFSVKNGSKGSQGEQGLKGDTGATGPQGDTYTITSADYDAIATLVIDKLPTAEGGTY